MTKKHIKKQVNTKEQKEKISNSSEKRQRHYAFGFLIGDY